MTDTDFRIIVFTPPSFINDEHHYLIELIDAGIDYLHLRKPGALEEDYRNLLDRLPQNVVRRVVLHDHYRLIHNYPVAGFQVNSRNAEIRCADGFVTRSIHSIEELPLSAKYEYVTLSPIYNSISKQGYSAAFSDEDLSLIRPYPNIIALGGVEPEYFPSLRQTGFRGGALLGYIWADADTESFTRYFRIRLLSLLNYKNQ